MRQKLAGWKRRRVTACIREGYFHALDARTGELLWKASVGGAVSAAPVTYQLDRNQYVAIAAGHALFVYGLRE
jgi:glucose dehydrogenase